MLPEYCLNLPEFCPNIIKILPEFGTFAHTKKHPPPPPHHICLCSNFHNIIEQGCQFSV